MNIKEERIKIISSNIKKYLNMKNMTQSDLANKIGVSKSTLSDYINFRSAPSYGVIQKIADVFEVNKSDIDSTFKTVNKHKVMPFSFNYNFFDTTLSAGALTAVDPFTRDDVEQISIPDVIMGKYAGDKDIFISKINGESMNNVLPNGSMVAVKKYDSLEELCDGDIVVFQDGGDMTVKRFHDNKKSKTVMFVPDSKDDRFEPIIYRYEELDNVNLIGKVIVYIVRL